jgi:hypothetical protein
MHVYIITLPACLPLPPLCTVQALEFVLVRGSQTAVHLASSRELHTLLPTLQTYVAMKRLSGAVAMDMGLQLIMLRS